MKLTLAVLLAWWTIYSKGMALSLPPSLIARAVSLQQPHDDAFAFETTLWPKDANDNMIVQRVGYDDDIVRNNNNNNNNNNRNMHKSYAMTHFSKRQSTTTTGIADADAGIVPTITTTTGTSTNPNAQQQHQNDLRLQERIRDQLPALLSAVTGARDDLNLDIGLVAPEAATAAVEAAEAAEAAATRLALPTNAHDNQNHAILLPLLAPPPPLPPPLQPPVNSYFATPLNIWPRQCASGKNCPGQNYGNQLYADRQHQQQLATMLPHQLLATPGEGVGDLLPSDYIVDGRNYEAAVAGLKQNPHNDFGIFKDAGFDDVDESNDDNHDDDNDNIGIELNSLELPDKVNFDNYAKLPTNLLFNNNDDDEDDMNDDDDDNVDSDDERYVSNDTFMLLTGERDLMKFLQWAMKQLYPYHKLTNFSDFDAADYNHPGMYIWKKFNLSGRLEPPLIVEEPHYVIVRRENVPEDFKAAPMYKNDPFIPPRGRKHDMPDLDALLYRYDTFVPNRGRRDKIKDIFKYEDVFFPNRGKRQQQQKKSPESAEGYNTETRDNNNEHQQQQQQQLIHGSWGNLKWKRKLQRIKNCLQYITGTDQAHIYRINCNAKRMNRFNGVLPQQQQLQQRRRRQQQQMSKYKINRYDQSVQPAMSVVTREMSAASPTPAPAPASLLSPTAAAITTRIGEIAHQQQQRSAFLRNNNNNNYALRQRRIAGHFMSVGAAAAAANRNRNRLHATRSMSTAQTATTATANNAQRNRQRLQQQQQQQIHYTFPMRFEQQQQ